MRDPHRPRSPHQNVPTPLAATILLVAVAVFVGSVTIVFVLDFAEETPEEVALATVEFAYDPAEEALTITHAGGSAITADRLRIRGRGIVGDYGDSRWTTGFGGAATGVKDGVSAVVAGDSAVVEVRADYVVRVIVEYPDEDRSAVLAVHRGPEVHSTG